jgi:hypothetical protein
LPAALLAAPDYLVQAILDLVASEPPPLRFVEPKSTVWSGYPPTRSVGDGSGSDPLDCVDQARSVTITGPHRPPLVRSVSEATSPRSQEWAVLGVTGAVLGLDRRKQPVGTMTKGSA